MFISGQVYEFQTFVKEGMGFTTNSASLRLLHAHRLPRRPRHPRHRHAGLDRCAVAGAGAIPPERAESVEIVGLYWHFVDVVWVLIFTIVYLIE